MPSRDQIPVDQLEAWHVQYGPSVRTIRRYLEEGEKVGDPCPLNSPVAFREWWLRHKKWGCPDWLNAAAAAGVGSGGEALPPAAGGMMPLDPVDLTSQSLEEGEAVRQARQLVAVAFAQLQKAYSGGTGAIDSLQRKWEKAVESLRKAEKDEREAAKHRGMMVSKIDLQRDVATMMELLRQMRESMPRRILELVPGLDPATRLRLEGAIGQVRGQEDGIFRMLPTLKGIDDVPALLAA